MDELTPGVIPPLPTKPAIPDTADSWSTRADTTQPSIPETQEPVRGNPAHIPGYEVLCELGRGGMGVVYKARQLGLDRVVALKVVLHAAHACNETRKRFRTEAQAVARLQHANIVAIHEISEANGLPYFSMEYCSSGSLAHRLTQGPMDPREAAQLVRTLALAMQAAHDHQVLHRDLKPANILLAADGTPKVADFGLARRMDETGQTASGAILGTPSYMAPEQARGKTRELGPATDIYALGAILFECLTGSPPFREESAVDTLMAVVSAPPTPPRQLSPGVPQALEAICLRCLEKAPAQRPTSARHLAESLDAFLAGRPIDSTVPTPQPTPRRKAVRRLALLGGCIGLLLCLALGIWAFQNRSDKTATSTPSDQQKATTAGNHSAEADDAAVEQLPRQNEEQVVREKVLVSALWAWAGPRFTVADSSLALWLAQSTITSQKPDLYALCVGYNDCTGIKGFTIDELPALKFALSDVEAVGNVLEQQEGSALYGKSYVDRVVETKVTAKEITARLKTVRSKVQKNDLFILYLSGRGIVQEKDGKPQPGTYFYLCADSNKVLPESMLTSRQLYDLLAAIPCRKLILLDSCHSGDMASNPLRDLSRDGVPFVLFAACAGSQSALEPASAKDGTHGLFTQCLLEALGADFRTADVNKDGILDLRELALYVKKRMPGLLKRLGVEPTMQTPVFLPVLPPSLPIAIAPLVISNR